MTYHCLDLAFWLTLCYTDSFICFHSCVVFCHMAVSPGIVTCPLSMGTWIVCRVFLLRTVWQWTYEKFPFGLQSRWELLHRGKVYKFSEFKDNIVFSKQEMSLIYIFSSTWNCQTSPICQWNQCKWNCTVVLISFLRYRWGWESLHLFELCFLLPEM